MPKKKKCRLLLCGGLGNQLFQYAFARCLSLRSQALLELDSVTMFEQDTKYDRTYELDAFKLPSEVTVRRSRRLFYRCELFMEKMVFRYLAFDQRPFMRESQSLQFFPDYNNWQLKRSVSLLGHWPSEHYFKDFKAQIKQDLMFRTGVCPKQASLAAEICSRTSAAVHVRRLQYENKLDINYYSLAMRQMREKVPGVHFYVFSDDPTWCRENGFDTIDVTLVDGQHLPAIEDFKLMTLCRHFIIANSTFSWWAAWLSEGSGSLIYRPPDHIWDALSPALIVDRWLSP
ncbi:alpha-1,2-fucosyltransferase [Rubellicoccus peritrichatus]|uniref:Alpha-1,2-fucosyltransferase n=1 Tax=Rubellicoccus peritrichatus TaxID=3080537 RepID=A0AAQ3QXD0_9BACT|nr:alpha-1,2-fucosyltransferase [Puniceicoccus sp. CR14]WOO42917.1 alpha-1,2-fucosyltransferase [Puniceicoccus sp. CR14]